MFHFPVGVRLMSNTRLEKSTSLPGNMMLIYIFYHIILIIGESVLFGGFKVGDEVRDVFGVDGKFVEFISDEDFILYDRHEL